MLSTLGPPEFIEKRLCPDCGAEEGWWHMQGCPHRPAPYTRVENAVLVRWRRVHEGVREVREGEES